MASTIGMVRRTMSAATAAAATATTKIQKRIVVEKITARVFCPGKNKPAGSSSSTQGSTQGSGIGSDAAALAGGNPVTIFAASEALSGRLRKRLAESCDWESVVVRTNSNGSGRRRSNGNVNVNGGDKSESEPTPPVPSMSFFMPSGEEVSFCAHAAIGGAIAMGNGREDTHAVAGGDVDVDEDTNATTTASWKFSASLTGDSFRVDSTIETTSDGNGGRKDKDAYRCCLRMTKVPFEEQPLGAAATQTLAEWSRKLDWEPRKRDGDASGNGNDNDNDNNSASSLATARNASVARPKTLFELASVEALHRAIAPPLPLPFESSDAATNNNSNSNDNNFAMACAAMDDSTGVYVYAPLENQTSSSDANNGGKLLKLLRSYECRQFPRASGYPEDPATGIAAAALAASLRFGAGGNGGDNRDNNNGNDNGNAPGTDYDVYQGTAMGRPSLIQVVDLCLDNDDDAVESQSTTIAFGLQGLVEIDDRCTIKVSD